MSGQSTNDRHECDDLKVRGMIAYKSIGIGWTIEDEVGDQWHCVKFCPYCGLKLDE